MSNSLQNKASKWSSYYWLNVVVYSRRRRSKNAVGTVEKHYVELNLDQRRYSAMIKKAEWHRTWADVYHYECEKFHLVRRVRVISTSSGDPRATWHTLHHCLIDMLLLLFSYKMMKGSIARYNPFLYCGVERAHLQIKKKTSALLFCSRCMHVNTAAQASLSLFLYRV